MNVGICSVGNELLDGDVADTNARWMSRRIGEIGGRVRCHLVAGDDEHDLVEALRWLAGRCEAVVCGGGLGPTPDDVTRSAIATFAGVDLERRDDLVDEIEARFASFRRRMPPSNLKQADVPAGARAFAPVGTAPGFAVDVSGAHGGTCVVYAVPGVPHEFQTMVERDVLTDLLRRSGRVARVTRTVHVAGRSESSVSEAVEGVLADLPDGVEVAFLADPDEIRVKIVANASAPQEARERAEPVVDAVVETLGRSVSGIDDQRLEDSVARLLRGAGLTVATAESCTGGLVSSRLSTVAGASDYLRGGLVAYQTDVKRDVLGIDGDVLEAHGPVAEPTAAAMATRARTVFDADLGLAVTCVAGPTTQGGRDVGTVIVALARAGGDVRGREIAIPGDRPTIQSRAATAALEYLRRSLAEPVA